MTPRLRQPAWADKRVATTIPTRNGAAPGIENPPGTPGEQGTMVEAQAPGDTVDAVRAYGVARQIDARLIDRWLGWASGDAAALLDVADALRLGSNHLGDVMTWLEEIAARDGTAPRDTLRAPGIRGVLNTRLGRSDKLKRVKALLRSQRFPRLVAVEQALDAAIRDLDLGAGVTVRFPPGLDGDELTIEVRARRPDGLRDATTRLHAAVSEGGFDRVFALLDEAV